ncbi:MAG: GGDEF domain-containing protein [Clostridiales bacterium]|nr:GGDEF domain-containing protein [Clostridiales bacterium]
MKICTFIGDMYRDYSLSIMKNINAYAEEKGHRVDFYGNCSIPTMNPMHIIGYKSILHVPNLHSYDGIIICYDTINHTGMGKELVDALLSDPESPPVVCIRAEINGFYNVVPDNRKMMRDIAAYIISKCSSGDIGFVTGRDDLADSAERRAGFEDAMHEAGYETSEDMIFHGNYWIDKGPQMADHFIKEDGTLPAAIICSNDYMAIGLIDELITRGFSIPEDCMVSGVDNLTESADHIPSITTIEISAKELAYSAMELLEKIHAKANPDICVTVAGNIIPRESTGDRDPNHDVFKIIRDLKLSKHDSIEALRQFALITTTFDTALTREECIQVSLENLRELPSVQDCYLCCYRENNRELIGYFRDKGNISIMSEPFPNTDLLPEGYLNEESGSYVFLPLSYMNMAYGYAILRVEMTEHFFINEKMEFIFLQIGHLINKHELNQKLFGIADIMDLYIKDPLTGMLNRRGFETKLSKFFDKKGHKLNDVAIASIDMDELKYINDTFGHNAGDEAIRSLARCVDNALNPGEFVARMGGDEFAAIIILGEVGRVGQFIRTVRNNIREINESGANPYELGASIGTCELTEWSELIECINKADKAMYLEKKAKKKHRR